MAEEWKRDGVKDELDLGEHEGGNERLEQQNNYRAVSLHQKTY